MWRGEKFVTVTDEEKDAAKDKNDAQGGEKPEVLGAKGLGGEGDGRIVSNEDKFCPEGGMGKAEFAPPLMFEVGDKCAFGLGESKVDGVAFGDVLVETL